MSEEKLLPCPFCGSSDIDPEGVASFKEEHRFNDSKFGWDNYEPHMIEHRPCCNKCGATTDGDWNIRKTTSNENKELGIAPCRCGGGAVKEVVEPHKHELAKWMPDYEGGVFVSCGKCSAMTSSVEDWNAIMASRPQPAIEGGMVERVAEAIFSQLGKCRDFYTAATNEQLMNAARAAIAAMQTAKQQPKNDQSLSCCDKARAEAKVEERARCVAVCRTREKLARSAMQKYSDDSEEQFNAQRHRDEAIIIRKAIEQGGTSNAR